MVWKTADGRLLYRVGDVIVSINSANPSKIYGGTWQLLCPGKTLVCIDTNDGDFNTIQKIGGNKYLQSHNHGGTISTAGSHTHTYSGTTSSAGEHTHGVGWTRGYDYKRGTYNGTAYDLDHLDGYTSSGCQSSGAHSHTFSGTTSGVGDHGHTVTIGSSGNGNTQNLQPYMVVYMWVRVS